MNFKRMGLAACGLFVCSITPASAQFEVAPDRFEAPAADVRSQATSQRQDIQSQIAGHQKRLDSLCAQIGEKETQIQATLQDLSTNGTEAGQDLALAAQQKGLGRLQKKLAPEIASEERAIVSLRSQLAAVDQPAPGSLPRAKRRGTTHKGSSQVALASSGTNWKDSPRSRR
jgi:chromosome segregation ATPase